MFDPETEKLVVVDAVPYVDESEDKVPDVEIVPPVAVTVKLSIEILG
jgi:hypothetical protein